MTRADGLILLEFLVGGTAVLVGCALFYWSKPISRQYNAWTTALRTKLPRLNKPPSARNAELNYEIMNYLIRCCGGGLIIGGGFALADAARNLALLAGR